MKTYDAIRISGNLTNRKHDLKSRMTSKTVPENAIMVLRLPNSQVWKMTGSECWEMQMRQKYIIDGGGGV